MPLTMGKRDYFFGGAGSMAVRGGVSLFDVQKLLGYQDIAIV